MNIYDISTFLFIISFSLILLFYINFEPQDTALPTDLEVFKARVNITGITKTPYYQIIDFNQNLKFTAKYYDNNTIIPREAIIKAHQYNGQIIIDDIK